MNPCRTLASPPPPFPCPETTLNSARDGRASDAACDRPSRIHTGYHGVLAPNAPWRRAVVARAETEAGTLEPCPSPTPADNQPDDATGRRARPKYRAWADLMRRAFEADVLACPKCGGRMIVLATIEDPAVIQRILTHLGLSMEAGEVLPAARASPWTDSPSE